MSTDQPIEEGVETHSRKRKKHHKDRKPKRSKHEHDPSLEDSTVEQLPREAAATNGDRNAIPERPVEEPSAESKKSKKKRRSKAAKPDDDLSIKKQEIRWQMSDPEGGHYINVDPVFTTDEKFFILATPRAVNIYSISTSILHQTLPVDSNDISSFALSTQKVDHLYIATKSGSVVLYNWMSGREMGRWKTENCIAYVIVDCPAEFSTDVVYALHHDSGKEITKSWLRAYTLQPGSPTKMYQILETDKVLHSFELLNGGKHIVSAFADGATVGTLERKREKRELDQLRYTWREATFGLQHPISCFAARSRPAEIPPARQSTDKKVQAPADVVDLVVGDSEGKLLVYDDFRGRLLDAEKKGSTAGLNPKILHWHREKVSAVKYSRDGNYIISGGQETVLVLWQLSTGKQQMLPHLVSPIQSLALSPQGSLYAVRLADNSCMVLSTTELKAIANVAGLQSHQISESLSRAPAALNPMSELLLAVPASSDSSERVPAPFLQRFDLFLNRHISRQALTRNNATSFRSGPGILRIQEPDITHLQLSHDGRWLAVVEEWCLPPKNLEFLMASEETLQEALDARREVYLKFWLWNAEKEIWTLETRIDRPHQFPGNSFNGRIFDLKADPSKTGFATVGEDSCVRIWRPKMRAQVKGQQTEALVTWTQRFSPIELESCVESLDTDGDSDGDSPTASSPTNARITYSDDGSLIAASQEPQDASGVMHYIDASTGKLKQTQTGMYTAGLIDLGFIGRHLIILSDSLGIWDVVNDNFCWGYGLQNLRKRYDFPEYQRLTEWQKARTAHLAINRPNRTFALALPEFKAGNTGDERGIGSQIVVFDVDNHTPLLVQSTPRPVTALLPAVTGAQGFLTVDSAAEIRTVGPEGMDPLRIVEPRTVRHITATSVTEEDPEGAVAGAEEDMDVDEVEEDREDVDMDFDDSGNRVVRKEQLSAIFDTGAPHALPPVRDLFDAVFDLYAGKAGSN